MKWGTAQADDLGAQTAFFSAWRSYGQYCAECDEVLTGASVCFRDTWYLNLGTFWCFSKPPDISLIGLLPILHSRRFLPLVRLVRGAVPGYIRSCPVPPEMKRWMKWMEYGVRNVVARSTALLTLHH